MPKKKKTTAANPDRLLRLGDVLKDKGITGKELAVMVDIKPAYVSKIVTGHTFPRKELLFQIARTLDVDLRELFVSTKTAKRTPLQTLQEIKDIAETALTRPTRTKRRTLKK